MKKIAVEIELPAKLYKDLSDYIAEHGIENIDEGIFGKILGGVAGFIVGPAIGRIIARALGVEKGILYDMFTSQDGSWFFT